MSRETFSYNYLIFRNPTDYILFLFPVIFGLLLNIFSPLLELPLVGTNILDNKVALTLEQIQQVHYGYIDNFLLVIELTATVLLAFFICYRWSAMRSDKSFGFWLTLGVNRRRFFLRVYFKFLSLLSSSVVMGFIILFYLNGISLGLIQLFGLFSLVLVNLGLVIGIGMMLGNSIANPEVAAISYIVLLGLNLVVNNVNPVTQEITLMHQIFHSQYHYKYDDMWLSLGLSLLLSLIIFIGTLRSFESSDIDL